MKGLLSEVSRELLEACEEVWIYGSMRAGDDTVALVMEDECGRTLMAAGFAAKEDAFAVAEQWQAFKEFEDGRKEVN